MKLLDFSSPESIACDICRAETAADDRVRRGTVVVCRSCARPRVVHEDELLRRLLAGDESAETAVDVSRWFVC